MRYGDNQQVTEVYIRLSKKKAIDGKSTMLKINKLQNN